MRTSCVARDPPALCVLTATFSPLRVAHEPSKLISAFQEVLRISVRLVGFFLDFKRHLEAFNVISGGLGRAVLPAGASSLELLPWLSPHCFSLVTVSVRADSSAVVSGPHHLSFTKAQARSIASFPCLKSFASSQPPVGELRPLWHDL